MTRPLRSVRSALAGLTVLVTAAVGASSASAAPRQPLEYDALGDSYASGYGVGPYGPCGRSDSAYAVQINGREKIDLVDFAACAGAKTSDVAGQLGDLSPSTDLVTVSVGGNDIGWSTAVGACLTLSDQVCAGAIAQTRAAITNNLPGLLDGLYAQIHAHAPNAQVLVTGYPRLFSPEYGPYVIAPYINGSVAEEQALNDGADQLNGTIKQVAVAHGFRFVDVTKRFDGHGVNAPDPWVNGALDTASFHPNVLGYEAYTAAVTAAVDPSRRGV